VSYLELPPVERARRALSDLGRTGSRISQLFDELSNWESLWSPDPEKAWNCVQVVGHMVDFEIVSGVRIRTALCEPGKSLEAFDQERWVASQRWAERPVDDLVDAFTALRRLHLTLLADLDDEEWERHYVHSLRGRQTVAEAVAHMQEHDARHLVQLGRLAEQARQARAVG
jgi:hypothetical protein